MSLSLRHTVEMVGGAHDENWITDETALQLVVEHGNVSRPRAAALLIDRRLHRGDDGWVPLREWNGWDHL